MSLILGKRKMTDNKTGGDVLMNQYVNKKWCATSELSDNTTAITIPFTPAEKLKVVFPELEDKVNIHI